MAKKKTQYTCKSCGYKSVAYMGKCPSCGQWETFEIQEEDTRPAGASRAKVQAKRLNQVQTREENRVQTSLKEFNRVMGGGILPDGVTILAASPGAGKSTLLFQVANDLAKRGISVLYASGEESETQIKDRALRISPDISDQLWIYGGTSLDRVLDQVEEIGAQALIVDSIQTFSLEAYPQRPGSPTQTMECAHALVDLAKNPVQPRMVFLVGQLTKENELAGVRALEHLVDTVLFIDHESREELRILVATKNRFGSTGEMGFFRMTDRGMTSIDNPSMYFMTQRKAGEELSGSALGLIKEGTRPVIVEVESLVSQSFTPYPQRISDCMGKDRLNTLVSILEERAGLGLFDKNIVIKTTGGISLKEGASSLAVLLSIASSLSHRPIGGDQVFIGDVGLTGEIKAVPSMELRLKEAARMGYKRAYTMPLSKDLVKSLEGQIEIKERRLLKEVIQEVLGT
ncbi:MAG: DNA repair protein RadA [Tissierellia bacterium]|nr:DNA repair protein RadA [Tissierellia bacterium]